MVELQVQGRCNTGKSPAGGFCVSGVLCDGQEGIVPGQGRSLCPAASPPQSSQYT